MRNLILTIIACLGVAAAGVAAEAHKHSKPDVGAGRIAWFDISSPDLAKSREFYEKLFDWKFKAIPETNLAFEIVSAGVEIGTLRKAEGAISPFNGVVYVQVKDIRASCAKAAALGGKVVDGFPFDLSDEQGSVGLVVDPAGHPIGLYSRTPLAARDPA